MGLLSPCFFCSIFLRIHSHIRNRRRLGTEGKEEEEDEEEENEQENEQERIGDRKEREKPRTGRDETRQDKINNRGRAVCRVRQVIATREKTRSEHEASF